MEEVGRNPDKYETRRGDEDHHNGYLVQNWKIFSGTL